MNPSVLLFVPARTNPSRYRLIGGGTLPFLAGRIESCIAHDAHLKKQGKLEKRRDVWDVLRNNIYLDAVIYADVGLKAAVDASGADRLLFGISSHAPQTYDDADTYRD